MVGHSNSSAFHDRLVSHNHVICIPLFQFPCVRAMPIPGIKGRCQSLLSLHDAEWWREKVCKSLDTQLAEAPPVALETLGAKDLAERVAHLSLFDVSCTKKN